MTLRWAAADLRRAGSRQQRSRHWQVRGRQQGIRRCQRFAVLRAQASRIESSAVENMYAVVVLVDARATGKLTLAQLTDYLTVVSLSQLDLTADIGGTNRILIGNYPFLHGLYRAATRRSVNAGISPRA